MLKLFHSYFEQFQRKETKFMLYISICVFSFALFFIYDINGATKNLAIFKPFFFLGGLLLLGDLIAVLLSSEINFSLGKIPLVVLAALFLGLLIYTLFFALPFKETYLSDGLPLVCDKGLYALCRHSGVLWMLGFLAMLCFIFSGKHIVCYTITLNLLNLIYVIFQDIYTFPKMFCNYDEYKKRVPFLIPNMKSIIACFKTL